MKSLDFNKIKRNTFTITLNDDEHTSLILKSPSKRIVDEMTSIQSVMSEAESDESKSKELIDALYSLSADLMSNNKGGIKITNEKLVEIFSLDDVITFISAYMEFIGEITSQKN